MYNVMPYHRVDYVSFGGGNGGGGNDEKPNPPSKIEIFTTLSLPQLNNDTVLPYDILNIILQDLPFREIYPIALSCKTFCHLTTEKRSQFIDATHSAKCERYWNRWNARPKKQDKDPFKLLSDLDFLKPEKFKIPSSILEQYKPNDEIIKRIISIPEFFTPKIEIIDFKNLLKIPSGGPPEEGDDTTSSSSSDDDNIPGGDPPFGYKLKKIEPIFLEDPEVTPPDLIEKRDYKSIADIIAAIVVLVLAACAAVFAGLTLASSGMSATVLVSAAILLGLFIGGGILLYNSVSKT